MKSIKLNFLLISLVAISGMAALFISAFIALYKTDADSRKHAQEISAIVKQQLEFQVLKVQNDVMAPEHFPDFFLWKHSAGFTGFCVSFETNTGKVARSLCTGDYTEDEWPFWFENFYLALFTSAEETRTKITSKIGIKGDIVVSPSKPILLHNAWNNIMTLMEFSIIVVAILSLLLYLCLHCILKPVKKTQRVLNEMQKGNLSAQVPPSHIKEWQETATAINNLAASLKETLDDRKELSYKLLNIQENERRYLCRELHDDMGQYLTGLRAISHFLQLEVDSQCPELSPKVKQVNTISEEMMELVKDLLFRLRPADLDALGISENLKSMIQDWNTKHFDKNCSITLEGEINSIPAAIAVNILRTIQECLTNIVKHASASAAEVHLTYYPTDHKYLTLTIQDNGNMTQPEPLIKPGNGLLGIKERINALNGELELSQSPLGGLKIAASIPVCEIKGSNEHS